MRIQTFSILVGSNGCNAKCPYCVSKMTPNEVGPNPTVNWRNFEIACRLARRSGATTTMLTGKGEPTLWPSLISEYIDRLDDATPLLELQTNGIRIAEGALNHELEEWHKDGLTMVALSVAHWEESMNASIYGRAYQIRPVVEQLHGIGYPVRLCCSMVKGLIDNVGEVTTMIEFARRVGADQLTFTPINAPKHSVDPNVQEYVDQHKVDEEELRKVREHLDEKYDLLIELGHGARVYDVEGQNVCLNNCLTGDLITDRSTMRNLIFHPDGAIRFDWEHAGSRIL